MTRKTIIAVIAVIYMVLGLLNLYNALVSALFSSGLFVVQLFPLVGGVLAFYAGLNMLRLNEFGRKLVVLLLSVRVVINVLFVFRLPREGAWLGVANRLGEIVYRVESPYAYLGFLLVWIAVALLTIVFLSQKETKQIFMFDTPKEVEPDIILREE
jgi:hypothetical protein